MDRDDIVKVLEEIGANNLLEQGQNVQCSCFLAKWRRGHRSAYDSKPSMGVSINPNGDSLVHCFACEFGGTLEQAITMLHTYGDEDLTGLLRRIGQMEDSDPEWIANSIEDYDMPVSGYVERVLDESKIAHMMGRAHNYILSRGFEIETLKVWCGGFDPDQKRIVFPVRRKDGALVGMVGRAILELQKPKYLNYFEFDKGRYLFGEHLVVDGTAIVVTEGLLDAVAVWQALSKAGMLHRYSVVSLLGAKSTKAQRSKLVSLADEVILFLDNDTAGWEGQLVLARKIQYKVLLKSVRYPDPVGGDPAELLSKGLDVVNCIETADLYLVREEEMEPS